eukprot:jgi/Tetstr1/440307/TSEL_028645.t2
MQLQRYRNPATASVVNLCAATVGWGYYLTGLPLLLWLIDAELGVQSIWLMYVATWMGNAIKDLLSAPRPLDLLSTSEKEKARISSLDVSHSKEYGAPSTHSMNSLAMNLYLVLALVKRGALSPASASTCAAWVCLWSAWLAFGRVFSALHTQGDCYLGLAYGLALAVTWSCVDQELFHFAQSSGWSPGCMLGVCGASILLYPKPLTKPTPSHDQVVCFGGVAFGAVVGVRLVDAACLASTSWLAVSPAALNAAAALRSAAKLAAGGGMLLAALKGSRPIFRSTLLLARRLLPKSTRQRLQPSAGAVTANGAAAASGDDHAAVEPGARFASYSVVGLAAVWGGHALFCALGWS